MDQSNLADKILLVKARVEAAYKKKRKGKGKSKPKKRSRRNGMRS